MSTFKINPDGGIVTATINFNNSSHAIAYDIVIHQNLKYQYQVTGDNKEISDDKFHLPSPAKNLIGCQFSIDVEVNRITNDNSWEVTLKLVQENGSDQVYTLNNNNFKLPRAKDSQGQTIDFIDINERSVL